MSVSDSVRMAITKAGISQTELAKLWGTSPQAIYNKLNLERWSAADLVRIAQITGGKLMFVYPDGQEILIDPVSGPKKETGTQEQPKKAKALVKAQEKKAPVKTQEKKASPKQKKEKKPEALEEQISIFNLT